MSSPSLPWQHGTRRRAGTSVELGENSLPNLTVQFILSLSSWSAWVAARLITRLLGAWKEERGKNPDSVGQYSKMDDSAVSNLDSLQT